MTTRNDPAAPCGIMQDGMNCGQFPVFTGMTKRESMMAHLLPEIFKSVVSLSGKGVKVTIGIEQEMIRCALQIIDLSLEEMEK